MGPSSARAEAAREVLRCAAMVQGTHGGDAEDRALLHAWQHGDAAAGERLMRRHYDAIRRFFEVKASFVADDLTQRTFLACVEAAASFRGDSSVRAFLFGIARKQYMGYQRKDGRRESAMQFRDFGGKRTFTSVSTLVSRREEQHLLLRALVDLPADQLMPLQLFYWEGMRTAEIAYVLEISPSAVTNRLMRARRALRDQIETMSARSDLQAAVLRDLEAWARSLAEAPARPDEPSPASPWSPRGGRTSTS